MKSQRISKKQDGIVLLEGLIAIVIFSFGVLAIVGMQAATVRASSDAKYRVDASFAVNQVLGQMWADRTHLGSYAKTDEALTTLPNGKRTVVVANDQVTVTVTWQVPGDSKVHTHSSTTRING
jgi:type IV pilus assembly protein PilV